MAWDEIRIPPRSGIGAGCRPIRLTRWLQPDDAPIAPGQAVCEIETEKAVVELEAVGRGVLEQIVPAGSLVEEGDLLGRLRPPKGAG